jgi:hypothetical protein
MVSRKSRLSAPISRILNKQTALGQLQMRFSYRGVNSQMLHYTLTVHLYIRLKESLNKPDIYPGEMCALKPVHPASPSAGLSP